MDKKTSKVTENKRQAMNEQDYKNLDIVFAIARKEMAHDKAQLIELLNLEEKVLKSLKEEKE